MADVFSSIVAIWGVNHARKPADKKHPYGYARYEALASLIVVALLFLGGAWIIGEALKTIWTGKQLETFPLLGVIVMAISVVLNEIMARAKFKLASEQSSVVLMADGQHDRADVIASVAVLLGMLLIKWIPLADAVLALIVGGYILYEALGLSRETTEILTDTANEELEERMKRYLEKNNFQFETLKTRKIGMTNFAEVKLLCNADKKIEEVDMILRELEKKLLSAFPELSQVTLSVKSHQIAENIVRPRFWGRFRFRRKEFIDKELFIPKEQKIRRIIIPLSEDKKEISTKEFGAKYYWLLDLATDGKLIKKEIVENPFYSKEAGRGFRFAREVKADKVIVKHIGRGAKENLEKAGIKFEVLSQDELLVNVLNKIQAQTFKRIS
jgi:cation diffusion facilitator family transporter